MHCAPLAFDLGLLLLDDLYFYLRASLCLKLLIIFLLKLFVVCLRNSQIFMIIALDCMLYNVFFFSASVLLV